MHSLQWQPQCAATRMRAAVGTQQPTSSLPLSVMGRQRLRCTMSMSWFVARQSGGQDTQSNAREYVALFPARNKQPKTNERECGVGKTSDDERLCTYVRSTRSSTHYTSSVNAYLALAQSSGHRPTSRVKWTTVRWFSSVHCRLAAQCTRPWRWDLERK
jgi:hypothetical protein